MAKPKKKKSVIPTYVFGITFLAAMVLLNWGLWRCLLLAWAAQWLASAIVQNRKEQPAQKQEAPRPKSEPRPEPKAEPKQEAPKAEPKSTGNPELDAVIQEGRSSVARLQQINDDIPDYKVSAQLKQIEILTASIIDQVERKPDKLKEVRQFMGYYLPTTIKLLEQYVQMQNVGLRGENIETGMQQIEDLLDKVIVAFQKQLDSLFERDVVDITADIQVMEQMMAAQGLTNSEF